MLLHTLIYYSCILFSITQTTRHVLQNVSVASIHATCRNTRVNGWRVKLGAQLEQGTVCTHVNVPGTEDGFIRKGTRRWSKWWHKNDWTLRAQCHYPRAPGSPYEDRSLLAPLCRCLAQHLPLRRCSARQGHGRLRAHDLLLGTLTNARGVRMTSRKPHTTGPQAPSGSWIRWWVSPSVNSLIS